MQKTLFELAGETYSQIAKIKQEYAQDIFIFLTYSMHKRQAEDAQEKYNDMLRKMKKN